MDAVLAAHAAHVIRSVQDSPFLPSFRGPRPPQGSPRRSSGSGFIIRKDGLIITNNHVVEGANEIMVNLPDEREYQATVLGRDPKTDLAVIKVEAEVDFAGLPALETRKTYESVDWVMAIGKPIWPEQYGHGRYCLVPKVGPLALAHMMTLSKQTPQLTPETLVARCLTKKVKSWVLILRSSVMAGGNIGIGFCHPY